MTKQQLIEALENDPSPGDTPVHCFHRGGKYDVPEAEKTYVAKVFFDRDFRTTEFADAKNPEPGAFDAIILEG